jgi:hypothetical protein
MTPRRHLLLAALFAVVIPAGSWLTGAGDLAYRMYSHSASYRFRVRVWNATGQVTPVSVTALAAGAHGSVRTYLAGADHWVNFARGSFLVAHVADLARLACVVLPAATEAEVVMDLRPNFAPEFATRTGRARCR